MERKSFLSQLIDYIPKSILVIQKKDQWLLSEQEIMRQEMLAVAIKTKRKPVPETIPPGVGS